jgi:hypothetical protein
MHGTNLHKETFHVMVRALLENHTGVRIKDVWSIGKQMLFPFLLGEGS